MSFGKIILKSLRYRLLFFFTVLSAIVTFTFTLYYVYHQKESTNDHLQHEANLILSSLKTDIRLSLYAEYREGIALSLGNIITNTSVVSIKILNRNGEMLGEIHKPMSKSLSHEQIFSIREDVTIEDDSFSPEAVLLGSNGAGSKTVGYIELNMDRSAASRELQSLYKAAMGIGFVFWLSTSIIGFFLVRHITGPFNHLLAGIKEIGKGNLSTDFSSGFDEETAQAATAVKELAESLKEREDENRRLNDDLVRSMRLEVREEKRRIMARLINTNRMTSLGLLVSSMAHEINNPNGSIRLSNEFLTKSWQAALPQLDRLSSQEGEFDICGIPYGEVRGEILRACDNIGRSTVRIEEVISNLRSYGLGERLKPKPDIDINEVVEQSLSIMSVHGRKLNVKFVTDLAPDLPQITGNAKQLEQVLINLLMNAAQAVIEGKNDIRISTRLTDDGKVRIRVADEGRGIEAQNMQRLFDPFFSTRIEEGGSGLGLYISRFIIDEHRGSISVSSQIGKGTLFTIDLPPTPARTVSA